MKLRNKKTNKKTIHAIFVIDESGSMNLTKTATISGINEQIQELKKHTDSTVTMSLIKFSGNVTPLYINQNIQTVEELTEKSYTPNGTTALFDAIAFAIESEKQLKHKNDTDISKLLIIVTDGQENSSIEHSIANNGALKLKNKLDILKEDNSWTVTFLGANIDLEEIHASLGIAKSNIALYQSNEIGTQAAFNTMSTSLKRYMTTTSTTSFYSSKEGISKI